VKIQSRDAKKGDSEVVNSVGPLVPRVVRPNCDGIGDDTRDVGGVGEYRRWIERS
jgi:hypothetical protein